MKNLHIPEAVLKIAVKESELSGKKYILCQIAKTTGFDWLLKKNENGEKTSEYCNIVGLNPFSELELKYEFQISRNIFVFYVKEKTTTFSQATMQDEIEYIVTGWDILYPVKHNDFPIIDLFNSKKFITENDLKN